VKPQTISAIEIGKDERERRGDKIGLRVSNRELYELWWLGEKREPRKKEESKRGICSPCKLKAVHDRGEPTNNSEEKKRRKETQTR